MRTAISTLICGIPVTVVKKQIGTKPNPPSADAEDYSPTVLLCLPQVMIIIKVDPISDTGTDLKILVNEDKK